MAEPHCDTIVPNVKKVHVKERFKEVDDIEIGPVEQKKKQEKKINHKCNKKKKQQEGDVCVIDEKKLEGKDFHVETDVMEQFHQENEVILEQTRNKMKGDDKCNKKEEMSVRLDKEGDGENAEEEKDYSVFFEKRDGKENSQHNYNDEIAIAATESEPGEEEHDKLKRKSKNKCFAFLKNRFRQKNEKFSSPTKIDNDKDEDAKVKSAETESQKKQQEGDVCVIDEKKLEGKDFHVETDVMEQFHQENEVILEQTRNKMKGDDKCNKKEEMSVRLDKEGDGENAEEEKDYSVFFAKRDGKENSQHNYNDEIAIAATESEPGEEEHDKLKRKSKNKCFAFLKNRFRQKNEKFSSPTKIDNDKDEDAKVKSAETESQKKQQAGDVCVIDEKKLEGKDFHVETDVMEQFHQENEVILEQTRNKMKGDDKCNKKEEMSVRLDKEGDGENAEEKKDYSVFFEKRDGKENSQHNYNDEIAIAATESEPGEEEHDKLKRKSKNKCFAFLKNRFRQKNEKFSSPTKIDNDKDEDAKVKSAETESQKKQQEGDVCVIDEKKLEGKDFHVETDVVERFHQENEVILEQTRNKMKGDDKCNKKEEMSVRLDKEGDGENAEEEKDYSVFFEKRDGKENSQHNYNDEIAIAATESEPGEEEHDKLKRKSKNKCFAFLKNRFRQKNEKFSSPTKIDNDKDEDAKVKSAETESQKKQQEGDVCVIDEKKLEGKDFHVETDVVEQFHQENEVILEQTRNKMKGDDKCNKKEEMSVRLDKEGDGENAEEEKDYSVFFEKRDGKENSQHNYNDEIAIAATESEPGEEEHDKLKQKSKNKCFAFLKNRFRQKNEKFWSPTKIDNDKDEDAKVKSAEAESQKKQQEGDVCVIDEKKLEGKDFRVETDVMEHGDVGVPQTTNQSTLLDVGKETKSRKNNEMNKKRYQVAWRLNDLFKSNIFNSSTVSHADHI